jgi:hypothetical protein
MYLRLHDPNAAAELLRGSHSFVDAETRDSARRRDAVFTQDFLRLVLVNLHAQPFLFERRCKCAEPRKYSRIKSHFAMIALARPTVLAAASSITAASISQSTM